MDLSKSKKEQDKQEEKAVNEKILKPRNGFLMIFLSIGGLFFGSFLSLLSVVLTEDGSPIGGLLGFFSTFIFIPWCFFQFWGLRSLSPNEALVLTLFGKYYGTINKAGFFHVNPFCSSYNPTKRVVPSVSEENISVDKTSGKKISLKAITLNNRTQKVNDLEGNPIEVAAMVVWKVTSPATAVFAVDHYMEYISTQADSILRSVACRFPYDQGDSPVPCQTLRGNSEEISQTLLTELQEKVNIAGLEILEARLTHLAYAPEIASAMLQRQQAAAILSARKLIVEGAVTMVQDALSKLEEENVVNLDDDKKATMISNLLVVLCANKEAQPVVNSGANL